MKLYNSDISNLILRVDDTSARCKSCPLSGGHFQGCELSVPDVEGVAIRCIDIRKKALKEFAGIEIL